MLPRSFWMQNNRNYESRDLPPIPYRRNSRIMIEVELTLNGTPDRTERDTFARPPNHRAQRIDPLILHVGENEVQPGHQREGVGEGAEFVLRDFFI